MPEPPDIGLADALTAWARLSAGPGAAGRIAGLLGFELRPELQATLRPGERPAVTRDYEPEIVRPVARPREVPARASVSAPRVGPEATEVTPWRRYLQPRGRVFAEQASSHVTPLPADSGPPGRPALEPLFAPRYTANIVQHVVATESGEGDLDLAEVVAALAERRPLAEWPREPQPSLRRGVQVLLDVGDSMMPFARDAAALLEAFRVTIGRGLVEHLAFAGTPADGVGPGPVWTWVPYRPPAPGTPVVVLSDLDLPGRDQGRSTDEDWLRLGEMLARQGSPLVLLVPFPARRWPRTLRDRLRLLPWDRRTVPSTVLRARVG